MLKLPKAYLSYSQLRVWLEDKRAYRNRYYLGLESPPSRALLFGSEIADALEKGTAVLPSLVTYPVREHQIKIDVEGVPFFAWIDTYWPEKRKFREYKTGQLTREGKDRWTQKEVDAHLQLDVYSTLIEEKEGHVDPECHLDWLEVKRKKKTFTDWLGNVIETETADLELTGRVESFARVITEMERRRTRALIRSVAEEISADYAAFLKAAETP